MLVDKAWLTVDVPVHPKVIDRVAGQSDSSKPKLGKPFLHGLCFVHEGIVMSKQEKVFPKLLLQH